MLSLSISVPVAWASRVMEALGVLAMLAGALVATVLAVQTLRRGGALAYRELRQQLGRAILLGLELLVAADIIRTVGEVPSLEGVVVLAIIVAIRTFLSFTLELELEGRWPWQARRSTQPPDDPRRET